MADRPDILIAHRGGVVDEERSENSFKALEEAIRRGYSHVEIDARITADGHVVCFHNDELMEEAGINGCISEMTRDEAKRVVLTRSGEQIPSFDAYCERCAGRIGVMIDLKGCSDPFIDRYTAEVQATLRAHDLMDDALILINKIPRDNQAPIAERFRGLSRVSWRRPLSETQEIVARDDSFVGDHYVFNHGEDFSARDVEGFHALSLQVIPGINTYHYRGQDPMAMGREHIRQLRACGVDGFQIDSCYDPELIP
ncbi:MAG: hypothetical protein CME19_15545 [Gemmatimonadetes bacterium]|nr:hypothetical protein [Gemmatimonadota bacterium]